MNLLRRAVVLLVLLGLSLSGASSAATRGSGHSRSYSTPSGRTTHVNGYYRRDGTYVHPYDRKPQGTARSYSAPSAEIYHYRGTTHYYGERDSHGRFKRSTRAKDVFKREYPCPSTGRTSGPCPGYVIDHIVPLKRGGADDPSNMQWQTTSEAKAKDKTE